MSQQDCLCGMSICSYVQTEGWVTLDCDTKVWRENYENYSLWNSLVEQSISHFSTALIWTLIVNFGKTHVKNDRIIIHMGFSNIDMSY